MMNKQEQLEQAKQEMIRIFQDYSIEITNEDDESYFDDGLAFISKIKLRFGKTEIKMRVEMIPEKNNPLNLLPSIEFGEDNWEEIDDEKIWRWLYFNVVSQLDNVKSDVSCLKCERTGEYKHGYICVDCLRKVIENEKALFLNKADNFRKEVTSLLLKQGREVEAKSVDAILKDAINYLKLAKKEVN